MARLICSMYWSNIDPALVQAQKRVFAHLGFNIRQDLVDGLQHGVWMNQVLTELAFNDSILFVDIDCIPLTTHAIYDSFEAAESGHIYGVAQTANHIPDQELIYAAPSFLSFAAETWIKLGQVSMTRSAIFDVGMALTQAAMAQGVQVDRLFPTFVCRPKWPLGTRGALGYGTFYNGDIFHLFQSRHNKAYEFAFYSVANSVLFDQPIDYVQLFEKMNSPIVTLENGLRSLPRNTRRHVSNLRKALFPGNSEVAA